MSEEASKSYIIVKNVRIAFPELFEAKQYQGTGKYRYSASFIVDKGSEQDKLIMAEIKAACVKAWGKKADIMWDSLKNTKDSCYTPGDLKDYDGYAGKMILRAGRDKDNGPVTVKDRDMTDLSSIDGRPYAGSYTNAKVEIWGQSKTYNGVRCKLVGVQFVKDGDAFGGGGPATADGFEEVVDESMDDLVG